MAHGSRSGAQYEGTRRVRGPRAGGVPVRLTWHPGADLVQGFTADGKSVLFTSARAVFTTRFTQLFTVPVDGGVEEALPIPNGARATYSPDGGRIAYNPLSPAFLQWKHYRGGRTSRIGCTDRNHPRAVPRRATAPTTRPMWWATRLAFRSEIGTAVQPVRYDRIEGNPAGFRHYDFPVLSARPAAGGSSRQRARCTCRSRAAHAATDDRVPADLRETRPRSSRARATSARRAVPSGARAVFAFRGEIVTVPCEKVNAQSDGHSARPSAAPAFSPAASRSPTSPKPRRVRAASSPARRPGEPRVSRSPGPLLTGALLVSHSQKIAFRQLHSFSGLLKAAPRRSRGAADYSPSTICPRVVAGLEWSRNRGPQRSAARSTRT